MTMPKFKPVILDENCAPRRVLELFSVKWTTMVLHALHFNGGTCRTGVLARSLPGVLEEDAHADATRDGTGQADRSEGLSGCPAEGRILPDAHGPALHRTGRGA